MARGYGKMCAKPKGTDSELPYFAGSGNGDHTTTWLYAREMSLEAWKGRFEPEKSDLVSIADSLSRWPISTNAAVNA